MKLCGEISYPGISLILWKFRSNIRNIFPSSPSTEKSIDQTDSLGQSNVQNSNQQQGYINEDLLKELFQKLLDKKVVLMDFIEIKEITTLDEFFKYVHDNTGLPDDPRVAEEDILKSLKSTNELIDEYNLNFQETTKNNFEQLALQNTSLPTNNTQATFPEDNLDIVALTDELISTVGTAYLSKFKKTLLDDLNRFGPIEYVGGQAQEEIGDDMNIRKSHVEKFFRLPNTNRSEFDNPITIKRWATIRYKLSYLNDVYPSLTDNQKKFVIKYILHGGKRCDDAKLEATNSLHQSFCTENKAFLDSKSNNTFLKTGDELRNTPYKDFVNSLYYDFRKHTLTNFLEYLFYKSQVYSNAYALKLKKDHATYHPATWNHLAKKFGVKTKISRYPNYIAKNSDKYFKSYLKSNFTPQEFIKFIKTQRKNEYEVLKKKLNLDLGYLESFFNNPKQKDNILIAIIKKDTPIN